MDITTQRASVGMGGAGGLGSASPEDRCSLQPGRPPQHRAEQAASAGSHELPPESLSQVGVRVASQVSGGCIGPGACGGSWVWRFSLSSSQNDGNSRPAAASGGGTVGRMVTRVMEPEGRPRRADGSRSEPEAVRAAVPAAPLGLRDACGHRWRVEPSLRGGSYFCGFLPSVAHSS